MSFIAKGASAFGKLLTVLVLAGAFLFGLIGVVYMSLQGEEISVPDLVGKDLNQSEEELTRLGLKIKERARRISNEKQNTILEQLPKPGETVKTGQMILVVVSKENPDGREIPETVTKEDEKDDIEAIEGLISDKPKKSDTKDTDKKKKSPKTRDVIANKADDSAKSEDKEDKSDTATTEKSSEKDDKKSTAGDKSSTQNNTGKPGETKTEPKKPVEPKPKNTPNRVETRPRKTPQP